MRLYEVYQHLLFEISDKVKDQMREKYREENPNLTDAQIDYYLDRWDRYSQSFPPNKRDITRLKFQELEQLIDNAEARSMLKGKAKQQYDFDAGDDLLYNQNNLVIYRGDMREKCIRYGEGYRWCISRKDASNMFYYYRFQSHEPTFYFVFDKDKPISDPYHANVIHVSPDGRYKITTAPNPGDRDTTWEGILQHLPKLRGLEQLFQPKPVTTDERDFYEKFGKSVDLDTYKNFNLKEKYYYIQMGHVLSTEQQTITPKELIGVYAKMADRKLRDLTPETVDRLSKSDFNKVFKNNPELAYEYARDIIKGRFPQGEEAIAQRPKYHVAYKILIGENDEELQSLLVDLLKEEFEYLEDSNEFILEERNTLSDILDHLGNDLAIRVAESIEGDNDMYMDFYHGYNSDQQEAEREFEEFFENNPEEKQRLVDYLKKEHDYEEEQDLFDFIYEEGVDDVKRVFDSAYSEGFALGAESEMYKDFEDVVKDLPYFGYEGDSIFRAKSYYKVINVGDVTDLIVDGFLRGMYYREDPEYLAADLRDYILEHVDETIKEELRKFDEPYYGWTGFDKVMAFERLSDELYELTYEKE